MFKNHIKIAWRNLWKHKAFSLINVIGLSIGLSATMVIGAIIYYDFSFDTFHKDKERIYRIVTEFKSPQFNFINRGSNIPLMQTLKDGMAGIEFAAPTVSGNIEKVENPELNNGVFYKPKNVIFTDDHYFQLFEYEWLSGDSKTALSETGQIVLEKEVAQKYFPHATLEQIQGRTLLYNDSVPLKVTGVIANFTENSDLTSKQFISLPTTKQFGLPEMETDDSWNSTNSDYQLFVKVSDQNNLAGIHNRLEKIALEHKNTADWAKDEERHFLLQPLSDFHFGEKYDTAPPNNSYQKADMKVLKALGLVALFLLLLGCANFINLNSAQALTRAKDIGIQKTLGSSKKNIIRLFYYETLILTSLSAVLSLFLAPLLLHQFKDQLPENIDVAILYELEGLLSILVLILIVSLLSGFYPAWVLSNFKPVSVLKGQMVKGNKGTRVRKTLSVFQFVVAQVFIIGTLLVGKQLYFVMHSDMGFNTATTAYLNIPLKNDEVSQVKKERLFNALQNMNGLSNISFGRNPPASRGFWRTMLGHFNQGKEAFVETEVLIGDENFLNTYGIPLIAGRHRLNDTIEEYVVNETLAKTLGFKDPANIVGTNLQYNKKSIPVVGVMADFNQRSLHVPISPVVITGSSIPFFGYVHFDFGKDSRQWASSVKAIEKIWGSIYPNEVLEINYMDNKLKEFYTKEQRTIKLLQWASVLAIIISCLGLLGLVIHNTERRVKEMGIRKVLGATVAQLNTLLCKEFLWLISIAFAIAVPLAWWGLYQWLQNFAYKTSLSWWLFVSGGLGMLILSLFIISIKTLAAAKANPVKSLRTE